MQRKIDLSIVIVALKTEYIVDCLDSLNGASSKINSETILIDNSRSGEVTNILKNKFKNLRIIRNKKVSGYGENNNLGLKISKGRYVLLLNDDTKILNKNIFLEMIDWMDKHPKVGVSSCALLNPDIKTLQGSGGYFPKLLKVIVWMTFLDDIPGIDKLVKPYHPLHGMSFYKNGDYFKNNHKQDWVTGAFFLMRKSALEQVGHFDADYFLYVEEVDLAYRFQMHGWETWYLPKWQIVHYGQSSTGSKAAVIHELVSLKLFYKKHMPKWQMPILRAVLKIGIILRIIIFGIIKGKDPARTYAKAYKAI